MTKQSLRQDIRGRLGLLSASDLARRSAAACSRLLEQSEYQQARTVMAYIATTNEVDATQLLMAAWSDGKRVVAPRVAADQRSLLPIEIRSLGSNELKDGYMGIREPIGDSPTQLADIDLIVVPGLAFDITGRRLGRGRGFYDRFLASPELQGVSCALALEEQFVPSVPCEEHDVRVQMLVTDAAVRRFASEGAA